MPAVEPHHDVFNGTTDQSLPSFISIIPLHHLARRGGPFGEIVGIQDRVVERLPGDRQVLLMRLSGRFDGVQSPDLLRDFIPFGLGLLRQAQFAQPLVDGAPSQGCCRIGAIPCDPALDRGLDDFFAALRRRLPFCCFCQFRLSRANDRIMIDFTAESSAWKSDNRQSIPTK